VDREKAETLGVPVDDIYGTLQILFGSSYVSQFSKYSRLWQVIVQAETNYRNQPDDIDQVFVRTRDGNMVPLKALITMRTSSGRISFPVSTASRRSGSRFGRFRLQLG